MHALNYCQTQLTYLIGFENILFITSISDQRKRDLNVFILNVFIKFLKTNIKDITCSWHCYVSHSRELKHGARMTGLYSDQSKTYLDVIKLFI